MTYGYFQPYRNSCAGDWEEPRPSTVFVYVTLLLTAIRVTCVGSCGVSNKANDGAWVVEESYFNSSLSLADKGECGSQP